MIQGTTETGFVFKIEKSSLNNMELIEDLSKVDGGDITALPKVLVTLLGEEKKKELYEHLRTLDGRVPIDLLVEEVKQIFKAANELKN